MNCLITGGAGFIGSSLADRLIEEGNVVINVDSFNDYYDIKIKERNITQHSNNPHYILYRCDICDYEELNAIFKSNKIDIIFHLAARAGVRPSIENPILYQEVNCRGTNNVLEMARIYGIKKIILASSSSVYGNNKKTPFSESDVVDYAISPYAATKKANEVLGHVYHKLFDIDMIFLRFFTVYGPRQRPDLAISKFTQLILDEKEVPVFGDESSARDYTFITDIIDGILLSMRYVMKNTSVYEIINLGENTPVTLKTMIHTIEKVLHKKAIIKNCPQQLGDVDITYADISKASQLLGYAPHVSFEDGIKIFTEWYKKTKEISL